MTKRIDVVIAIAAVVLPVITALFVLTGSASAKPAPCRADGCALIGSHEAMRLPACVTEVDIRSADGRVQLDQLRDGRRGWVLDGIDRRAGRRVGLNGFWDTRPVHGHTHVLVEDGPLLIAWWCG